MKWRLITLTGKTQTQTKDGMGNTIVSTAPAIAIFEPVSSNWVWASLLIYRTDKGMYACTTGKEGETVTDRLPQDTWEGIHSKAVAAFVMLGRVPNMVEEII